MVCQLCNCSIDGFKKKTTGNSGSTLLRFSLKILCSSSFSHNFHMKKIEKYKNGQYQVFIPSVLQYILIFLLGKQ